MSNDIIYYAPATPDSAHPGKQDFTFGNAKLVPSKEMLVCMS